LAHIAASMHEGLLEVPAQRPGTQDGWLNIIAMGCRSIRLFLIRKRVNKPSRD
jgi:hypothetical protein